MIRSAFAGRSNFRSLAKAYAVGASARPTDESASAALIPATSPSNRAVTLAMAVRIIRWVFGLLLFAFTLAEIARRGRFLRTPAVTSNRPPSQASLDPYLLFLKEAGRRIPAGTTVAVAPQNSAELAIGTSYLLALSQMPDQTIVPWTNLDAGAKRPDWVMSFGTAFGDPRFRLVAEIRGGRLFQAVR